MVPIKVTKVGVCALIIASLLITMSTAFVYVHSQMKYILDLTDCSVRTDKDSYQVGEDITITVYIGKRIPDEIVSSYFLSVSNTERTLSEIDLGFLPRGTYNKTIIAEPPIGHITIQLHIRPKPNVDVTGQIGNPTYSFEITERELSESNVGVVLLVAIVAIIAIVISILYTHRKRPVKKRKRAKSTR